MISGIEKELDATTKAALLKFGAAQRFSTDYPGSWGQPRSKCCVERACVNIPSPTHTPRSPLPRLAVDNPNTTSGPVYKGLVFGTNSNGVFLFATDFRSGKVASFAPNGSTGFRPTTAKEVSGSFTDPDLPAGFAPFGIQNINGNLFITYALQNQQKHDDVAGPGNGFVDIYDTDGNLLRRFASRRPLNSPWGVTRASFAFGRFSGDILVGNFGDGKIHAFDSDGDFRGTLSDENGRALVIDGLWTLTLGGGKTSNSDTLYFTAGPNGEMDGLFGTITPVADNDVNRSRWQSGRATVVSVLKFQAWRIFSRLHASPAISCTTR